MGYMNGYEDNFSSSKIPYDDIPIARKTPQKKNLKVSISNFKILVAAVAILFVINIGLCIALVYHVNHSVVKNVVVNHNNISAIGDTSAIASDTAKWSSVCVAAGGSCTDENSFYKNTASRGSGVIYKIDETKNVVYFITCYHVIDGYDKYYLMLPSQLKPIEAKLVGYSSHYDVAVLKINDTSKLDSCTAIQVFDSTYITFGEKVYAVGNSLSGGISVTDGSVSRINTLIKVEGNLFDSREIQTSAEINPGNSGGGLFNNEGKFVGLVNAKLNTAQSGNTTISVTGTAYAIPSKLVTSLADSMINNSGAPTCVDLGVTFKHNENVGVTPYEFQTGKRIDNYNVIVSSASSLFGELQKNDQIVSFKFIDIWNKEHEVQMFNMYSFDDVKFIIKPQSTITFKIVRAGAEKTVSVTASSFSTY